MSTLIRSMKWLMLASGILTCTMFYAALFPTASLTSTFGEAIDGPVAQIVVRNWGVLIGIVGLMLIYGAFRAQHRRVALLVAVASKTAFVSLVLVHGRQFLQFQVGTAVILDSVTVVLFAIYLVGTYRSPGNSGVRA